MEKFKWVIVGCGNSRPGKGGAHSIGYCHAAAISRIPGLRLAGVADCSEQNLRDFTAAFPEVPGYPDYRQMFDEVRPDVVSVCTWARDREIHVIDAIRSGAKAVLIEKPIALTVEAGERFLAEGKKHGVRLFVNHQRRYGLPFIEFRKTVMENSLLGPLQTFDIDMPFANIFDFGPHLLDTLLFVLGDRKPLAVFANADRSSPLHWHGIGVESQMTAALYFEDGILVHWTAGEMTASRAPLIRANFRNGFAELVMDKHPGDHSVFRLMSPETDGVFTLATDENFHHGDTDPVLYMERGVSDIRESLLTGKKTELEAENALFGVRIINAVHRSAETGRTVKFETSGPK